jgi:opacity protein-like surface antigen
MKSTRRVRRSMMATAATLLAGMLATGVAAAQAAPSGGQGARLDLAVTYDTLHTNHLIGQEFWAQGAAVELGARLYGGLGVAARAEYLHAGASSANGEPLSLVTAVFGPRYTMESRSHRYAIFGEGLVGVSNGYNSLFSLGSGPVGSANTGTTSSATSLAVDVGGGLDLRVSHHLAIRAIRASYLYTQFPNTTTNVQNSLSIGAGLVFRFGE